MRVTEGGGINNSSINTLQHFVLQDARSIDSGEMMANSVCVFACFIIRFSGCHLLRQVLSINAPFVTDLLCLLLHMLFMMSRPYHLLEIVRIDFLAPFFASSIFENGLGGPRSRLWENRCLAMRWGCHCLQVLETVNYKRITISLARHVEGNSEKTTFAAFSCIHIEGL